jgi:hypothetical protein
MPASSLKKGTTAGCPKFGKTHFSKTCLPILGTSMRPFWREIGYFFARSFLRIVAFIFFNSMYGVDKNGPKKFRKLPSARRIFPKVFRRSHFWT